MKFMEAYEKGIEIAKSKASKTKYEVASVELYHNGFPMCLVNEIGDLNFISHIIHGIDFMESDQWSIENAN